MRIFSSSLAILCAAASILLAPALSGTAARASAACPAAEVVFARGRDEPPGLGQVGQAFVDTLKSQTGKDIGAYPVVYPAQLDVSQGVADMTAHIRSMVANCPGTALVVGGYSLGAAVSYAVLNSPLPPGTDQHIAAVVTFGNASKMVNVPAGLPPAYSDKSIDLCNPGDPICSGGPFWPSHLQVAYIAGGPVGTAADFAAGKL